MPHLAIYLDSNLDPPGVAHYSDPVPLLSQGKTLSRGWPTIWTIVSARRRWLIIWALAIAVPLLGGGWSPPPGKLASLSKLLSPLALAELASEDVGLLSHVALPCCRPHQRFASTSVLAKLAA